MRIFTRYILREVLSYAALGGLLFTFVLFMRDMSKIIELLVRGSASLMDVARIFGDLLPNTLTFTLPTAVLAGVLLGLGRLAADSEITAMRACGMGAGSFVRIVSVVALLALAAGLVNTLYFAPHGAADLLKLQDQLKTSQAAVQIQPRVFYEDFRNYVLYVQDVRPAAGAAVWHNVFLADLTQPANPNIKTADQAVVTSSRSDPQGTRVHLLNAHEHQISQTNSNQYELQTYGSLDLPLEPNSQDDTHISRVDTPLYAQSMRQLLARSATAEAHPEDARIARIELNRRFAYPFACLVLMLIGVPLGLSSRRGGKSTGFVLTLMLVFGYYLISNIGVALAKNGRVSPFAGVWAANICFAFFGLLLLRQVSGGGFLLNLFHSASTSLGKPISAVLLHLLKSDEAEPHPQGAPSEPPSATVVQRMRRRFRTSFPLLLDEYVMRSYATNLLLSLTSFSVLYIVFTFFELMGDIVRNQTPFVVVGAYLFNLIPFIISEVTPICSLLAVLITFGSLNRASELTAMKATGISLYRVVAPILLLAAVLVGALFAFNESYLPGANRKQEALRAEIKGKPAQTFQLPGRTWISGQTSRAGDPTRIFYYQAFDPARNIFADLSVFEFDSQSFTLERRIYAKSVQWDGTVNRWIFDNGWQRTFSGTTVASYQPFTVATFPEIREQPAYFNKENKPSDEMSYAELSSYIADLKQSGFNTVELRVQLQNKLSVPAISFIMAILAVPFALAMGKRGGLVGIATAICLALAYWTLGQIFSSMGNVSTLPPVLAAWSPDLLFGLAGGYMLLRTPT